MLSIDSYRSVRAEPLCGRGVVVLFCLSMDVWASECVRLLSHSCVVRRGLFARVCCEEKVVLSVCWCVFALCSRRKLHCEGLSRAVAVKTVAVNEA